MLLKSASIRFAAGASAVALTLATLSVSASAQTFRDGRQSPIARSLGQAVPPSTTEGPQILPPAGAPVQAAPAVSVPQRTAEPVPLPAPVTITSPGQFQPLPVGPVRQVLSQPSDAPQAAPGLQVPTSTVVTADGMPEQAQPGAPGQGPVVKKAGPDKGFVDGKRVVVVPSHQPTYAPRVQYGHGGWVQPGHSPRFAYGHGHGHGFHHGGHGFRHGHGHGHGRRFH